MLYINNRKYVSFYSFNKLVNLSYKIFYVTCLCKYIKYPIFYKNIHLYIKFVNSLFMIIYNFICKQNKYYRKIIMYKRVVKYDRNV